MKCRVLQNVEKNVEILKSSHISRGHTTYDAMEEQDQGENTTERDYGGILVKEAS